MYEMLYNLGQALRPGAWAVDHIPWLKYIPFYTRALRKQHQVELALFRKQIQGVRDEMVCVLSIDNSITHEAAGRGHCALIFWPVSFAKPRYYCTVR
jgi:hypothetical protein